MLFPVIDSAIKDIGQGTKRQVLSVKSIQFLLSIASTDGAFKLWVVRQSETLEDLLLFSFVSSLQLHKGFPSTSPRSFTECLAHRTCLPVLAPRPFLDLIILSR